MWFDDPGGTGNPVLFLHGSGCDSDDWAAVIGALRPAVRAIRADFPGHGRSDVPGGAFRIEDLARDVLSLVEHLALARATLVGHSLGGMVALAAASVSPHIERIVLLEGWTSLRSSRAFAEGRVYGTLAPGQIAAIQRKAGATRDRFSPAIWQGFWESARSFNARPWLDSCRLPVVEVYGDAGRTDSTRSALDVPDRPNIRFVWIPGAGHYLPHEVPGAVANLVSARPGP